MTCLMLAGCDDPARNMFDGIRNNNEAHRTPEQREMQPAPSYDEYTKERKRIEDKDSPEQ
ncbi:MAG: hypothetical protein GC139_03715 [Sideroxydans sp.]|nr:hypothetical protein [Sideroxydans sp.]